MSNVISDWRGGVQTLLAAAFPSAVIDGGRRAVVNREPNDLITVFWPGWPVVQRDTVFATPTLTVRYFPSLSKQPSSTSPRDQEALEQAAIDLMAAFVGKNKVGDIVADLACRVTGCVPHDSDAEWFVEVTLQAYTFNVAERAA